MVEVIAEEDYLIHFSERSEAFALASAIISKPWRPSTGIGSGCADFFDGHRSLLEAIDTERVTVINNNFGD